MKGYKAFKKGLICDPTGKNPKQYAENTVFEESTSTPCHAGMHFCKYPLDVLNYYPLVDEDGDITEFAEVEPLGEVKTDDDIKYCTDKLKIGKKLNFSELVTKHIEALKDNDTKNIDDAQIGSSGDCAQIGSSGDCAKINSCGRNAVIMCAGEGSLAKAQVGSWITLAEWGYRGREWTPICVKTEYVDGERIKADTYYRLQNGEFCEVQE